MFGLNQSDIIFRLGGSSIGIIQRDGEWLKKKFEPVLVKSFCETRIFPQLKLLRHLTVNLSFLDTGGEARKRDKYYFHYFLD